MYFEVASDDVIVWSAETETEKKISQVANILKTRRGEIPFLREVGLSDEYINKPISLIKPVLINDITATIKENVEGVSPQSIDFVSGDVKGNFIIKAVCKIE